MLYSYSKGSIVMVLYGCTLSCTHIFSCCLLSNLALSYTFFCQYLFLQALSSINHNSFTCVVDVLQEESGLQVHRCGTTQF